jgi:hypothetical protein
MLSSLTIRLVSSLSPPLAELSSPGTTSQVNPTSLQLALIGFGTLAAYAILKRARASRQRHESETTLEAFPTTSAPIAAPHFAERPTPILSESVEDAA